jgi:MOSC domain-containing protein YiiM
MIPCDVCGFDPANWTVQDMQRTLAHADGLIAGWSSGAPDALRPAIDGIIDIEHDDPVEIDTDSIERDVHRLWHRLVTIADVRRANGDAIANQRGAVAQLSRSNGGVPKLPVDSALVDLHGVVGDVQRTRLHHGRPWQALCLWSAEVVDALVAEGHPIGAGAAGENVTISGVDWSTMRGGAIIDIGSVRCQLSAPATPCSKNRRWFLDGHIDRMDHDRHPGWSRWYATVLRPGSIETGSPVEVEPPDLVGRRRLVGV